MLLPLLATLVVSIVGESQTDELYQIPRTLKHVSVVFRHADRTPDPEERFPNDPNNSKMPLSINFGELTEQGKIREYQLGKFLRKRYGNLLGDSYLPGSVYAQSTDSNRTRMSLKIVLTALYPNKNPSIRQALRMPLTKKAIPMYYLPYNGDYIMNPMKCPEYKRELNRIEDFPEVKSKINELQDFFLDLTRFTGKPVSNLRDAYDLYHSLSAESAMNLTLPEWTKKIFPNGKLLDAIKLYYEILGSTTYQRRITGGKLLKLFIEDMENIRSGDEKRKLSLYSGHEKNVAAVLQTLGVYQPHVPQYSSAVIVEFHHEDDGSHCFVKVFYYLGIPAVAHLLTIPNCNEECDYLKFLKLIQNVTPSLREMICDKRASLFIV